MIGIELVSEWNYARAVVEDSIRRRVRLLGKNLVGGFITYYDGDSSCVFSPADLDIVLRAENLCGSWRLSKRVIVHGTDTDVDDIDREYDYGDLTRLSADERFRTGRDVFVSFGIGVGSNTCRNCTITTVDSYEEALATAQYLFERESKILNKERLFFNDATKACINEELQHYTVYDSIEGSRWVYIRGYQAISGKDINVVAKYEKSVSKIH